MKAALTLLALVFFLLVSSWADAAVSFASTQRYGKYRLTGGTDDCPQELNWEAQAKCVGGFRLQEINAKDKLLTHSENFCNVDKKAPTKIKRARGDEKFDISYTVQTDGPVIQKNQTIQHHIHDATYSIQLQASLILSDESSFLYERSLGNKGWSCLYKK